MILLDVLRQEKKYRISLLAYQQLDFRLQAIMQADQNNNGQGYLVRSLYFDTVRDQDYAEKLDGLHERKKIRLRIYDPETKTVKLEMKEKIGENQRKRSLLVTKQEAQAFIQGDFKALLQYKNPFALELYGILSFGCYRPKCIIEYRRKAYISATNQTRLTFDYELQATEANLDLFSEQLQTRPIAPMDSVVFEVKYDHFLLTYIRDLIRSCNKTESAMSKYCMGRMINLT
ncbi:polyphosphate polymerase domain-containing protein [Gottschalkiaceae bacterium SANA]|nr:polyphosphate polymerase domain-containing protein [Gottschalkiaceae bacterium SANA]